MTDFAIHTEGLSKRFELGVQAGGYATIRDMISTGVRSAFRRDRKRRGAKTTPELWALRDVNVDIKPGEVVGVVGRNGAGKSTFLKVLSRITEPSSGFVDIRGRVGSLLEVGAGFHAELTGLENIFLNSAILGMRKREIRERLDEIVAFAELADFLHTPVKHYSSGMYMRLAFSVAAHLDPDILLIDEVLAVGDAAFQNRCLGKMEAVAGQGRTVLLVSHNMGAVRGLCQRAIWLNEGKVEADGDVYEVVQQYLDSSTTSTFRRVNELHKFAVEGVTLRNGAGEPSTFFAPGEPMTIEIDYEAGKPIEQPFVILVIQSIHGKCFTANMLLDGNRPEVLSGRGTLKCSFDSLPLLPQSYSIGVTIRAADGRETIVGASDAVTFNVAGDMERFNFRGERLHGLAERSFPVVVPYEWEHPDGTRVRVDLGAQNGVAARLDEDGTRSVRATLQYD